MILSKWFPSGRIVQRGVVRVAGTRGSSTSGSEAKGQCGDNTQAKECSVVATTMMADGGAGQRQAENKNSAVVRKFKLKDGGAGQRQAENKKSAVVGMFKLEDGTFSLSEQAQKIDAASGGKLTKELNEVADRLEVGKALVVVDVADYWAVALASYGPADAAGFDELESLGVKEENIRWGVGAAVRALQERGVGVVEVDPPLPIEQGRTCSEAAYLAAWQFDAYKSKEDRRPNTTVQLLPGSDNFAKFWDIGAVLGDAQNWARELSEQPANKMTPTDLAQAAMDVLCPLGVKVVAHDRAWIEAQHMEAFLAVARGSCEEPLFLECMWKPNDGPTVMVAAKGVTFDSGGLCLKKREHMVENRGSMAGAAAALGAMKAVATLKMELNVTLVIPLCENMISGQCMKVGDVVRTLNGLSVLIEDTDMEGRLMLADALVYGQAVHRPEVVIDVATLTHGILRATAGGAFGAFTNDDELWNCLRKAGAKSGDRPWRFPLWDYYQRRIVNDPSVDLRNRGSGKGTPCLGAAFLKNFVCGKWIHMDTTGVGKLAHDAPPYLSPGYMTGRPTRTLYHLLEHLVPEE